MTIKQNKFSNNSYFMRLALMQAQKTLGNTKTNPAVGCVIVKHNCVISAGCTGINGTPHAEHDAIISYKKNIKDAKLYVTLEPCSHYGKTSPCVKSIIKKKIGKVFFSIKDPDQRSFNKSSIQFKKEKISVKSGICVNEIGLFYKSYLKFKKNTLPYVTCKLAVSNDFFTNNKKNKWITNKFSRSRVHLMRSNHDCIITSAKTIINDNPRLTCRIDGLENKSPSRVILDKKLITPITSRIIKEAKKYSTIIFYNNINRRKVKILENLKIKMIREPLCKDDNFNLKNILAKIKQFGFSRIFIEAGLNLTSNFLNNNLVDDFHLFISNKKLGKNGHGSIKNFMKLFLKNKKFVNEKVNLFGDKLISYSIK